MTKATRRPRKTDIVGVDVTCWGRLFQVGASTTGKVRSLTVDSRVRRTISDTEEAEQMRCLRASRLAVQCSQLPNHENINTNAKGPTRSDC